VSAHTRRDLDAHRLEFLGNPRRARGFVKGELRVGVKGLVKLDQARPLRLALPQRGAGEARSEHQTGDQRARG
jgi:hypothetical protein